jgi:hypothetical protein
MAISIFVSNLAASREVGKSVPATASSGATCACIRNSRPSGRLCPDGYGDPERRPEARLPGPGRAAPSTAAWRDLPGGGWTYIGTRATYAIRLLERLRHPRSISARCGHAAIPRLRRELDPEAETTRWDIHKYVLVLDDSLREQIEAQSQSYPKRTSAGSIAVDASADQAGEGGSSPTPALQPEAVVT